MRFFSCISQDESSTNAVEQVVGQANTAMKGKIDAAFVFLTAHHVDDAEPMLERLWLELDPQIIVGCSGEGVIGDDKEIERSPGLSLLVGEMPGVRLHPFHIAPNDWNTLISDPAQLTERIGHGPQTRAVVAFGDPFTTPVAPLLPLLDKVIKGVPVVGGMASAARSPGGNVLLKNDRIYKEGMVGVSLNGPVAVQTVVSQGCRPIGQPMVITKAHDNVIEQLGGKPALVALRAMAEQWPADEMQLIQSHGLLIGRAMTEYKDQFSRGDFLVRSLAGVDESSGAIAVGDYVRAGQTVQFQVRDSASAHEDLTQLLQDQKSVPSAAGALLFSCNGRGLNLFDKPGHDISVAHELMPMTPVAGFFAAGELGPVGGRNFIHGHTASFALLRPE